MCMSRFRSLQANPTFLIVVPTAALLDQWYVSLLEDFAVPEEAISSFSGEEKADEVNAVNLIVLNTARELAQEIASQHNTFLIVDECHRAGSPVNARALRGNHEATLGLSATPEREYDEGFQEYVVPALGQIIYNYDYLKAYRDKVISPFQLINIRVELLEDEKEKYDELSRRAAREIRKIESTSTPSERLKRILQQRAAVSAAAAMRIPVAAKLTDDHRGQRTLIFHERVDKANILKEILVNREHSATLYHSKIAPVVRRDNLKLYRYGVFDVLISCRALDEGTNVPETAVSIIASSTASLRQRIQRLGRVLRPAAGKSTATVYTIYATDQEEQRLIHEARSLEGITSVQWRQGFIENRG